jgi:hypothetical protein
VWSQPFSRRERRPRSPHRASAAPATIAPAAAARATAQAATGGQPGRGAAPAGPAAERGGSRAQFSLHWVMIFSGSLGLFLLRFLVPSPVGLADNGDGPRVMCGLGVAPVTGGHVRYDAYAYFRYALSPGACAHAGVYDSSQHLLVAAARWLTPVLGLSGMVSLIALGVLMCLLASAGIAALACGLAPALRSRLVVAGALWLVMADAAFFDTYASPYSEGATLIGLLLLAAGLIYLGRGGWASVAGFVLAGSGGYLTILSKEQYLPLAAPICVGVLLAAVARDRRRGPGRVLTRRMAAAVLAIGIIGAASVAYAQQDASSPYTRQLHQEQVVDVIFGDIANQPGATPFDARTLRALGLPDAWAEYSGNTFWSKHSVYDSVLYPQFADKLTDTNLAHYLLTHPVEAVQVAQHAAAAALQLRVNYLGSYAPGSNLPPGTLENRVGIVSSIVGVIPAQLGLFWLIPLWAAMLGLAVVVLRHPRKVRWHHDAAVAVICLTGCAIAAFIPAAFFAGIEPTRHMMGMNMATALAFAFSATLLASLLRFGLAQDGRPAQSRLSVPAVPGPRAAMATTGGSQARG